jgi:bisphosphoglycerate-independent phosphoglycerate mutase (AlkP superfamily)
VNALEALKKLDACAAGIDEVREAGTFRAAWETSTNLSHMTWLLRVLPQKRTARVAIRCAETVAHLMPAECLPLLADVSAYVDGDTSINIHAVQGRLWGIDAAAAYAADAACAAICDVICDEVDADEIAAAMKINPDEVL